MRTFSPRRPDALAAFTLVEMMAALAVMLLILVALADFTGNVDRLWSTGETDPFAEAGSAFETVAVHLAGATLESYEDYADASGAFPSASTAVTFVPDHPTRRSDLAFACGPESAWLAGSGRTGAGDGVFFITPQGYTQADAHLGLEHLFNALGNFVDFGDQTTLPSFVLPGLHRWRWRLKEILQPSESLGIYSAPTSLAWVQPLVQTGAATPVLAENVAALIVLPDRAANDAGPALAPQFSYDSRDSNDPLTRHQLPSRLRLALVAIDEASASILAAQNGTQPPALIPASLFLSAARLDTDLASLDTLLTTRRIGHRIFQREIVLPAAAWSNTPSS